MKIIELDASQWRSEMDFYEALLAGVGAPSWHGRNINALLETMIWYDDINAVSPPYVVRIKNASNASVRREIAAVQGAFAAASESFGRQYGRAPGVSIEAI